MLEENRDLLNDITNKENCKEGAAQIPKLIFDLVSQADQVIENPTEVEATAESDTPSTSSATESNEAKVSSAQEIIHNLPKVWRVLTELLNHQKLKPVQLQVSERINGNNLNFMEFPTKNDNFLQMIFFFVFHR